MPSLPLRLGRRLAKLARFVNLSRRAGPGACLAIAIWSFHRFDPLTRPSPADENAGGRPPSPPKGRGRSLSHSTVSLLLSFSSSQNKCTNSRRWSETAATRNQTVPLPPLRRQRLPAGGTVLISDVAPASSRHLSRQDGGATFKLGHYPEAPTPPAPGPRSYHPEVPGCPSIHPRSDTLSWPEPPAKR